MAKLTFDPLLNLDNPPRAVETINANFERVRDVVERTLSRDGTSPNQMLSVLDMNGRRIINLAAPRQPTDVMRVVDLPANIKGEKGDPGPPGASPDSVYMEHYDTDTDFADSFEQALTLAGSTNRKLVLQANKTYTTKREVLLENTNVFIEGNNAKIVRGADGDENFSILRTRGTYENENDVVAVTIALWDYSVGSGGTSRVSRLEMASAEIASSYAVGQVLKVVADDKVPSSPTADNERIGEIFSVGAIDDKYIYSWGPLVENYQTSIRVARINSPDVVVQNIRAGDEDGSPTTRSLALFRFENLVGADIQNLHFRDVTSTGLQIDSSYRCYVSNISGVNQRTSFSESMLLLTTGYVVVSNGSQQCRFSNLYGENTRHVFTTGARKINGLLEPDLTLFGASIHCYVQNIHGHDCQHYPADTHADAFGIVFDGVLRSGGHQGISGGTYALQLRGRKCVALGVYSWGAGAIILQTRGNDGGHYVEFNAERPTGGLVPLIRLNGANSATVQPVTIKGRLISNGATTHLIYINNVELTPDSEIRIINNYDNTGAPLNVRLKDAKVGGTWHFDFTGSNVDNASNIVLFDLENTVDVQDTGLSVLQPEKVTFKTRDNAQGVILLDSATIKAVARFDDLRGYGGTTAGGGGSGFLNTHADGEYWADFSRLSGNPRNFTNFDFLAAGTQTFALTSRGEWTTFIRVGTILPGVIINAMTKGNRTGQLLFLRNDYNAPTQSIVFQHNTLGHVSIENDGSDTFALAPWQTACFVWDGVSSVWRLLRM